MMQNFASGLRLEQNTFQSENSEMISQFLIVSFFFSHFNDQSVKFHLLTQTNSFSVAISPSYILSQFLRVTLIEIRKIRTHWLTQYYWHSAFAPHRFPPP